MLIQSLLLKTSSERDSTNSPCSLLHYLTVVTVLKLELKKRKKWDVDAILLEKVLLHFSRVKCNKRLLCLSRNVWRLKSSLDMTVISQWRQPFSLLMWGTWIHAALYLEILVPWPKQIKRAGWWNKTFKGMQLRRKEKIMQLNYSVLLP